MRLRYYICFFSVFILLFFASICFSQTTGLWVAQKIEERGVGKDSTLEMDMTLIDKKGKEQKRNLFVIRKNFNGQDKLLLRFTYPNDIKGTSFLVWEHKEKDNERFLYLPALGRIRRIATREKDENFAGTDFSYEDISGRKLEDYTYQLMEEEVIYEENACYLLASYPKDDSSKFPKVLSWVRKDNFVVVKAEYYNTRGQVEKTYKVFNLQNIDGIWTPLELSMENYKTNHKTFIKVKEVQYNRDISDQQFEKRELER